MKKVIHFNNGAIRCIVGDKHSGMIPYSYRIYVFFQVLEWKVWLIKSWRYECDYCFSIDLSNDKPSRINQYPRRWGRATGGLSPYSMHCETHYSPTFNITTFIQEAYYSLIKDRSESAQSMKHVDSLISRL